MISHAVKFSGLALGDPIGMNTESIGTDWGSYGITKYECYTGFGSSVLASGGIFRICL